MATRAHADDAPPTDAEDASPLWTLLLTAGVIILPTGEELLPPDDWILVGTWTLPRESFTAFDEEFQLWATRPEEVAPLTEHLEEFQSEMPDGVELEIQELAGLRAAALMDEGP